jgi:hypothetical protein
MGEDGIEDSLHAGSIGEDTHGPSSSSQLSETPFDEVSGTYLLPESGVFDSEEG